MLTQAKIWFAGNLDMPRGRASPREPADSISLLEHKFFSRKRACKLCAFFGQVR